MVTCEVCLAQSDKRVQAVAFMRRRVWNPGRSEFVERGVTPLCYDCLRRRREMLKSDLELPWHEAIAVWNLQQVHES